MEQFKSNSDRSKRAAPEKKIEKVVSGKVQSRKKSGVSKLAEGFLQKDMGDVKSYILSEVIIPHVQKTILDVINNGLSLLFYGEIQPKSKGTNASKVSYRSYYEKRDNDRREVYRRSSSAYDFDDIAFESRGDAEEVLVGMQDIIDRYDGVVSVFDLYELAGVHSDRHTDNKYGWTDISSASVGRTRDGYYVLKLPRVMPID